MSDQKKASLSRAPIMAMLLIASAMVAAMAGLSWENGRDHAMANEESKVSRQVQDAADGLLSTVKDAETGQRGYLLTGKEQYLDIYHLAVAQVSTVMDKLRVAAAARQDQTNRYQTLEPVVLAKMRELTATVELRRTRGFQAALEVVDTGEGKLLMDNIRVQSAAMRDVANQRVEMFSALAETSASRLRIVSTAGSLVLLGFLVISARTILRGLAHREELYHRAESNAEHLRVTLASIGDAVIATDALSQITFINPVGETLTGWTKDEAAGKPMEEVFRIVNESNRAPVANPAEKAIRTGTVVGLANHTVLITKQGNEIAIDDSGAPIRDPNGRIVGAIVVFRDISERRLAERQLKESNEQLQQFVTAAAHDLRSPLTSTHRITELLTHKLANQLDEEGEELLGYVRDGIHRVLRLVQDLLAYAHASHFEREEGKQTAMETVLKAVLENLRSDIESNAATITAENLPVVAAHEAHLIQLLQNLIGNALKYRGDAPPHIRISCDNKASEWVICVNDNGIGIEQEYLRDIFKPFKRLHGEDRPGSGIGLASCHKIVSGYGGSIWVTSEVGKGSTFFFSLPRSRGNSLASAAQN